MQQVSRRRMLGLGGCCAAVMLDGCSRTRGSANGPRSSAPSNSSGTIAPTDVLPTQGTLNTRQITGYRTADGRVLRTGLIYRSSALTYATAADLARLRSRNITDIIDFRGPDEAAAGPDKQLTGSHTIHSPVIQDALDYGKIDRLLEQEGFSAQMRNQKLVNSYGPFYRMFTLVNSYGSPAFVANLAAYRPVFETLLDQSRHGAILMHCTGGRDRTGIATALLLRTLGVPMPQIERDYLASNILLQPDRHNPASTSFKKFSFSSVYLQPTDNIQYQRVAATLHEKPARIYDAVKLKAKYLTSLFAVIDKVDGSFPAFLERRLGMDEARVGKLKQLMLNK